MAIGSNGEYKEVFNWYKNILLVTQLSNNNFLLHDFVTGSITDEKLVGN